MFSLAPTSRFYSIHVQVSGRAPSEFGIACNVKVIKGYQLMLAHFVCYPPMFRSYLMYLRIRLIFNIIIYWVYQYICYTRRLEIVYLCICNIRDGNVDIYISSSSSQCRNAVLTSSVIIPYRGFVVTAERVLNAFVSITGLNVTLYCAEVLCSQPLIIKRAL